MKYPIFIIALFLAGHLSSCTSCNKSQDVICDTLSLQVAIVGPDSTYLNDYVFSIRYQKNTSFATPLDTGRFLVTHSNYENDTLLAVPPSAYLFSSHNPGSQVPVGYLFPNYDYKLIFQRSGEVYLVTDITPNGKSHQVFNTVRDCCPNKCYDKALSCKINGNPVAGAANASFAYQFGPDTAYVVYLHK
jgi:hypothetical protein